MKRKLRTERLEDRRLLAADLTSVNAYGSVAVIVGNDQSSEIRIEDTAPGGDTTPWLPQLGQRITVTDFDLADGTSIMTVYELQTAYVYAFLGGGDDVLINEDETTVVQAYAGGGNDQLVNVDYGFGGPGEDFISLKQPIAPQATNVAFGGPGDDFIVGTGRTREIVDGGAGFDTAQNVNGTVRNVELILEDSDKDDDEEATDQALTDPGLLF